MDTQQLSSYSVEMGGLDGTNPLGFLTALGALVVARTRSETTARLRWTRGRTWTPVLDNLSTADPAQLSQILADGLRGKEVSPDAAQRRDVADKAHQQARTAIKNETDRIKEEKLKGQDRKAAIEARVRPLERIAADKRAEWLMALKNAVPRPELALGARIDCTAGEYRNHGREFAAADDDAAREALHLLAAFGSDACCEDRRRDHDDRRIETTPFCFLRGAGNQNFLDTVLKLLAKVTAERVGQALFEPWEYRDEKLSMRWDPGEDKRYALTDTKPADEGALTVWMANLLAYRGLSLFPCAPARRGLGTTAWTIIQEEKAFTWPVWDFAAGPDMVRTLLQLEDLRQTRVDRSALDARGIAAVFRARRIRVGKYVNFSPARGV